MPNAAQPQPALRLRFEYANGVLRQTGTQKLNMMIPPSAPTEGYQGQGGFWYELRDKNNRVLYRRIASDPMSAYQEVHSPGGTPKRTTLRSGPVPFEVVVPDLGDATHVAVVRSPEPIPAPAGTVIAEQAREGGPRIGTAPAQEIARFDLRGTKQ